MADPHVICPFDKSHKIMMSRLQAHLLKCMKSHFTTGPTICPFSNEHIIDASQIVEHCIICPNIKDVLIQTNIRESEDNSSNDYVSPTSTSACNSAAKIKNYSTAHSNTEMQVETFYVKSRKLPKNEKSKTSMKVPDVEEIEKTEKSKSSSQDVLKKKTIFEEYHTSDASLINLNSHCSDQPELSTKAAHDYGEIYQKLEALEKKEMSIAKEMQILRQKEKEIGEEKKELIEILKNLAFHTNITNYSHNNNNQERKDIISCKDDKVNTNTKNNIDEHNEQNGNTSNCKSEEKYSNFQDMKPSMISRTSSLPIPGSSPNTNKMQSFGRGIMRAYNIKKKILSNKTN